MQLNDQQRQAINHIDGPLLILAGAGTGKTRVIVEKVGHLLAHVPGLQPGNILALTFSDKAANEMKQRAAARFGEAARGCRFSTFHSFCYQLLSEEESWKPLDEIDHWIFLRRNLESLDLDHYLHVSDPGRFLHDLLEFCSRCHDNLVTPETFRAYVEERAANLASAGPSDDKAEKKGKKKSTRAKELSPEDEIARQREVTRVFARSEAMQEAAGLISFGAMLSRAALMLRDSIELRERLQWRYRYILVDEFQDTNWAQIETLRLLAGEKGNIAVVGDPNQAIYHFRGASYTSFQLFREAFPGYVEVQLTHNYRSTKQILSLAKAANSFSPRDPYRPETQPLRASKENPEGPRVKIWEFINEAEQAEIVAREIARQGQEDEATAFSSFAVLYRNHSHRNLLVEALRRNEVPFVIRKLAIDKLPAVRDMVAALRAIGQPHDSVSLLRMAMHPRWKMDVALLARLCHKASRDRCTLDESFGIEIAAQEAGYGAQAGIDREDSGLFMLVHFLRRHREIAKDQRLGNWLNQLRQEMELFPQPEELPAWRAFFAFVLRWQNEKSSTGLLGEFLEYFAYFEEAGGTINLPDEDAELAASEFAGETAKAAASASPQQRNLWDGEPSADARGKVQLMTMHAAKGLEFDRVFLLQLLRRSLPSDRKSPLISFPDALVQGPKPHGDVHIEEERRLFYVALTRAMRSLTLCTVANDKQKPSMFLEELRNSSCPDLEWKPIAPCGAPPRTAIKLPPLMARPGAPAPPAPGEVVLSDSALEAYLLCPLKYYYSHVWHIPGAPSAALRFGSIMHSAIRRLVGSLAHQPGKIDAASVEGILREHWSATGFTDPAQEGKYWRLGLVQLEGIRRAFAATPFDLLHQEKSFQFVWAGTQVLGRIDQINRIHGKQVELIEFKTGRAKTQKDADGSLQLTIYAHACRAVLDLEPVELVLYNVETQERLKTRRGPEEFRELEGTLAVASAAISTGQFQPSSGYHCRFCDFSAICPAQEG